VVAVLLLSTTAHAVEPHRSFYRLPTGNGHTFAIYDAQARRVNDLREHPYLFPEEGVATRNLCFDTYFGARAGGESRWLTDVAVDDVGYIEGTNVVRVVQRIGGVRLETILASPFGLEMPALLMLLSATNEGSSPAAVTAFSIHNFHLGAGRPSPGSEGERIIWDGARASFVETGPGGGAMVYRSLGAPTRHAASPNNPFEPVRQGRDLTDTDDSGVRDDAVAGFQRDLGTLVPGETAWWGVALAFAPDGNGAAASDRLGAWIAGRSPDALLAAIRAEWESWHRPLPPGLSAAEASLWRQSAAVLRMGQVREPGRAFGQIVASLPPGRWNITWARDLAYAAVALARMGHLAEARQAIEFVLGADTGYYRRYVGHDYLVSVARYFGRGKEESDSNEHGPNIELDGFGLFLWLVGEYAAVAANDPRLRDWQPIVQSRVADVLLALVEPATGLIRADSSIWEVHWNGRERRFAYTTLSAANGLCGAARVALLLGDATSSQRYAAAAAALRQAAVDRLRDRGAVLAQSREDLLSGTGYLDAAALEAVSWAIVDPAGATARATVAAILEGLRPPSGRGLMRNDDGGWYDSQEWIFVDLRAATALRWAGRPADSDAFLFWNVEQARANFGLFAELHDATTADYAGEVPMVGFGAGAYALAMLDRERPAPSAPPCGAWPDETRRADDAGMPDAGTGPVRPDRGCGCAAGSGAGDGLGLALLLALAAALRRARCFFHPARTAPTSRPGRSPPRDSNDGAPRVGRRSLREPRFCTPPRHLGCVAGTRSVHPRLDARAAAPRPRAPHTRAATRGPRSSRPPGRGAPRRRRPTASEDSPSIRLLRLSASVPIASEDSARRPWPRVVSPTQDPRPR
jgi:GH15 family glucan-1,4-alpha-glucosidase